MTPKLVSQRLGTSYELPVRYIYFNASHTWQAQNQVTNLPL